MDTTIQPITDATFSAKLQGPLNLRYKLEQFDKTTRKIPTLQRILRKKKHYTAYIPRFTRTTWTTNANRNKTLFFLSQFLDRFY